MTVPRALAHDLQASANLVLCHLKTGLRELQEVQKRVLQVKMEGLRWKGKSAPNTVNHLILPRLTLTNCRAVTQAPKLHILLTGNRPYSQSILKMLPCPIMKEYIQQNTYCDLQQSTVTDS